MAETIAYGSIAHTHTHTHYHKPERIETALIIVSDVMLTIISVSFYLSILSNLFFLNWSKERAIERKREIDREMEKSTAKLEQRTIIFSSMVRNQWQEWYTKATAHSLIKLNRCRLNRRLELFSIVIFTLHLLLVGILPWLHLNVP